MQDCWSLRRGSGGSACNSRAWRQHFLKRDGVMWVKASGTWMMEATARSILVPVDIAAVLDGLARRSGLRNMQCLVRHDLVHSPLRPSIETTLHASCRRGVVHVHCVETISIACLSTRPSGWQRR